MTLGEARDRDEEETIPGRTLQLLRRGAATMIAQLLVLAALGSLVAAVAGVLLHGLGCVLVMASIGYAPALEPTLEPARRPCGRFPSRSCLATSTR